MRCEADFGELKGKILSEIIGLEKGSEMVVFLTTDKEKFTLWHDQQCCETVEVEDIIGNPADLIGSEILLAEERTNEKQDLRPANENDESWTWIFYELATIKGNVTIRWYGGSWNGYYSEKAKFRKDNL